MVPLRVGGCNGSAVAKIAGTAYGYCCGQGLMVTVTLPSVPQHPAADCARK